MQAALAVGAAATRVCLYACRATIRRVAQGDSAILPSVMVAQGDRALSNRPPHTETRRRTHKHARMHAHTLARTSTHASHPHMHACTPSTPGPPSPCGRPSPVLTLWQAPLICPQLSSQKQLQVLAPCRSQQQGVEEADHAGPGQGGGTRGRAVGAATAIGAAESGRWAKQTGRGGSIRAGVSGHSSSSSYYY